MKKTAQSCLLLAFGLCSLQQLQAANLPPTVICPAPGTLDCSSSNNLAIVLEATVSDPEADALTVVWTLDGAAAQTNHLAAGSTTNATSVQLAATLSGGQHQVQVSVSDTAGNTATCESMVSIGDTTPPAILSVGATPAILWPPNHQFVPVTVSVTATDACGTVSCRIKSVTSDEAALGHGSGHTTPDWIITGDLTLKLRAERSGHGNGRRYTITVECTDAATNSSTATVAVLVPHDQRAQPHDNGAGKGHTGAQDAIRAAVGQNKKH